MPSFDLTGCNSCVINLFGSPEGVCVKELPSCLTIDTATPLDEDWPLVWLMAVYFNCPINTCVVVKDLLFIAHHNLFKNGIYWNNIQEAYLTGTSFN